MQTRAYRMQFMNGELLAAPGPTDALVVLHENGTYAWFTTYANARPLPDVGRYVLGNDGSSVTFTPDKPDGEVVVVPGVMTDSVLLANAPNEAFVGLRENMPS